MLLGLFFPSEIWHRRGKEKVSANQPKVKHTPK